MLDVMVAGVLNAMTTMLYVPVGVPPEGVVVEFWLPPQADSRFSVSSSRGNRT